MLAASFLTGAKDRLLPASVPFRYFTAAVGFQILAWLVLIAGAGDLPGFTGSPGLNLASLHLFTLGVLVMTAMGACFQLLPIATRQPLSIKWPTKLSFWLFMPGTLFLAWGMVETSPLALYVGGVGVGSGLLIFAVLTAGNLYKASFAMPIVTTHAWAALVGLLLFGALGLNLVIDFNSGYLVDRQIITNIHMVSAIFGFMGLLVFGFSHVLIPMFVLSRALPKRLAWLELVLALLAITIAIIGIFFQLKSMTIIAMFIGLGASGTYLLLMRSAFQTSMRRRLGLSFLVIKMSWVMLILALLIGLAVLFGVPLANGATLFGFLLLVGWLATFLSGILQRIMPFLASMHVVNKEGKAPLLSELTAERPLMVHATCHFAAIVFCSTGIVFDNPLIVKIGAGFGLVGALAFAAFTGYILSWLKKP